MQPAQITIREIKSIFRQRRKIFFVTAGVISSLCIVGAFLLPSRYESSTTILVQRDEVTVPLISHEWAMALASEDRLKTFEEIIYSRPLIDDLIDSLQMDVKNLNEQERQDLTGVLKRNIKTERRGSDSFRITYIDTDPERARLAASAMANLFIQKTISVQSQQNERAVQFFENKLEEIRERYEISQRNMVATLRQRINQLPAESRVAYGQVEDIEKQINDLDNRIKVFREKLGDLTTLPSTLHTESGKQMLYDLARVDIPFASDLRNLLTTYDEFLRRYTAKYPEVQKIEKQILDLLDRIKNAIEVELARLQPQRRDYENRRAQLVDEINQSAISARVTEEKEGDYDLYRRIHNEMTLKLEQARTTRDLGKKGASQFVIIDPAIIPTKPSKPNRPLIIAGGIALSLFLGFVRVVITEMLDTTVRMPRDLEVYQKPVIALISEGGDVVHRN